MSVRVRVRWRARYVGRGGSGEGGGGVGGGVSGARGCGGGGGKYGTALLALPLPGRHFCEPRALEARVFLAVRAVHAVTKEDVDALFVTLEAQRHGTDDVQSARSDHNSNKHTQGFFF